MIDFHDVEGMNVGGGADTLALLVALAAGFVTLPVLYGATPYAFALGAFLAALGGWWFGWRIGTKLRLTHGGVFDINSHEPPAVGEGGVRVGYVAHTMQELLIGPADWTQHAMAVGKSGFGKTVLGAWLMFQQIARGGGLLWIDGKLDAGNIEMLHHMCCWAGRPNDLLIVNPGTPDVSNTYNPLLDGDADEVAARLGALLPDASANAAADYYRASAINAVGSIVAATRAAGYAITFDDLRILLTRPAALNWLLADLRKKGKGAEAIQFDLFLDQLRVRNRKTGADVLDQDGLRNMFGGLGARLAQFGGGKFGAVMNAYAPEVRMKDVVRKGKVLYVALPTMGKGEAALALGKMAVADFRGTIADVQALPEDQRPNPPFLGFFDEAGSYVTQQWAAMFEQARSARLVMVPAFQVKQSLEVLGPELLARVTGNTMTRVFFKTDEPKTAEWIADMIGQEAREAHTWSESSGSNARGVSIIDRGRGASNSTGESRNITHSVSMREDYKVTPSDMGKLDRGECVVTHGAHRVFHVLVPRVMFDKSFIERVGPFRPRRPAGVQTPDGLEPLRIMQRPGAMR